MNSFMQNILSSIEGSFLVRKLNAEYSEEWGGCYIVKKKLRHFISKPDLDPS